MTRPCSLCHTNPAEPHRGLCANCRNAQRREQARANAKERRSHPESLSMDEFEAMQEAVEIRARRERNL